MSSIADMEIWYQRKLVQLSIKQHYLEPAGIHERRYRYANTKYSIMVSR